MGRAAAKPKTIRFPRGTTNVSGQARMDKYGYVLTLFPVGPVPRDHINTRQENQLARGAKRSGQSYRARHKRPLRRKGARG